MNLDKTKTKCIGSYKYRKEFPFGLDWTDGNLFPSGVYISGDEDDLNFRARLLNMRNVLRLWKCMKLFLKRKIVEWKTFKVAYDVLI